jgi:hypothetical protein
MVPKPSVSAVALTVLHKRQLEESTAAGMAYGSGFRVARSGDSNPQPSDP